MTYSVIPAQAGIQGWTPAFAGVTKVGDLSDTTLDNEKKKLTQTNRSVSLSRIVAVVLAGGEGSRLYPLTKDRAKPAVPFGGRYRLVDFVLSNLINSGIVKIKVLTQFKSDSLIQHINRAWVLSPQLGQYVDIVPAQMRLGPHWYSGNADAVYQNLEFFKDEKPPYICIMGADHIYRMNVSQMLDFHIAKNADVTVAVVPFQKQEATQFGVVETDSESKVLRFAEKSNNPVAMPGNPDKSLVSMGIYIFTFPVLEALLEKDAQNKDSTHDFGRDIFPDAPNKLRVFAYDFTTNRVPGITPPEIGYWRDVGSIESYYQSNMDLINVTPIFNLYNYEWPIFSHYKPFPPTKFNFAQSDRMGTAVDSIVGEGSIISGGRVERSVIFPGVRIHSYSLIEDSIVFEGVSIGRYCRIRRAIIDKEVNIPPNTTIGYDLEADKKRFDVSPEGIVVIYKRHKMDSKSESKREF